MLVILLRHASAGHRKSWDGDDEFRPLDERGRRQSEALVEALARWRIERVLTSPLVRCVETVEPLATALGLEIEEHEELAEGSGREEALGLIEELGGASAVLCTHGDVVEELLGRGLKKGAAAVLEARGDRLREVELVAPPA
jgi:phosphohistidine phosphatase SixA